MQRIRTFLTSQNYAAILLIILAVIAIRLPIDYKRMMEITDNDYTTHIYYALDMLAGREVPAFTLAHSLWQLGLIFVWWASRSRIDFWQSAISFQVLSAVAAALIVYFWYGSLPGRPSPWKRAFWAISLVIVAPIIAPGLLDGAYYFGYIGLANYHNPTVHVLRPFALLLFIIALRALHPPQKDGWLVAACALLMATATFLKPSYTVTMLPALGLMVLYWLYRRRPVHWLLIIAGLGIPAVLLLSPQFIITYVKGEIDGGIAIMPFAAANMLSGYVALKFFMSIFFPLAVTALNFKRALRDPEMALAWLSFAAGAAEFYLFIELGSRFTHANFLWGAQITLFVLFAACGRFLLRLEGEARAETQVRSPRAALRRLWAQYGLYLPHIASGIAYYIFCYVTPHYG